MAKNLIRLLVDKSGVIRADKTDKIVEARPIESPKIIRAYLGDRGKTKNEIKKLAPRLANAYALGDHTPNHLDCYPIQYYSACSQQTI